MSNVIRFPNPADKRRAEATDLVEAIWLAAILLKIWQDETEMVACGRCVLVEMDGRPLSHPYSGEPTIRYCGSELPISTVIEMAVSLGDQPLPKPLSFFLDVFLNSGDPEDHIATFADAWEILDCNLDIVRDAQTVAPVAMR